MSTRLTDTPMLNFLISETGTRLRYIAGGIIVFVALLLAPRLTHISVDNSMARWVEQEPETTSSSDEQFEDLVTVLIQISGDTLFTQEGLDSLLIAFEELESIPDVTRVDGVPGVYRDQFGLEDIDALEDEMRESPYFQKFYVTPDLDSMAFFVMLSESKIGHSDRDVLDDIAEAMAPLEKEGFALTMVGPVVMNAELDRLSLLEAGRLFPMALALSSLILIFMLRSFLAAVVAVVSAGFTLVLLMECMALSGYTMNMITVSLPPLILVLSLSASIHTLHRFLAHHDGELTHSLRHAFTETVYPNTFASLTTALGFLSLRVSSMAPVQELGLFVAIGMTLSVVVNLTVTPLLIIALKPRAQRRKTLDKPERTFAFSPRIIIGSAIGITVLIIPGIFRVHSESNPLSMFSPESPIHHQYASMAEDLAGVCTLETIIQLPTSWHEPDTWPIIEEVAATLNSNPVATKTLSPLDALRLLNQWDTGEGMDGYKLPKSRIRAEALLQDLEDPDAALISQFSNHGDTRIRLITFVNELDSGAFLHYVDDVEHSLAVLPDGYSGRTTGTVLGIVRAQNNLVTHQFQSFGLAFGVIFVCMFVGLGSWRLFLLSIPPNILPIATVFGIMGYLDIPLNTGSVMVASVVLGIGVDDTVHMLMAIRRTEGRHSSPSSVVQATLKSIYPALITTTSVIGSGFLVITISDFVPLVHFGGLATLAIVVALWADLQLVPAMILYKTRLAPTHE
ncbi:MAG: MMPL family transporter [Candidatus Hydrogenedentota bacterium]